MSTMGDVGPLSNGPGSKLTGRSLALAGPVALLTKEPRALDAASDRSSLHATNPRNLAAPRVIAT